MGQDVFVDVGYRGLEVGRRVRLVDVGPHTAHLEHGTPMPVGSGLVIRTDEGLAIPVVVIRVHEQVAGAELPPGMRVKAEQLEGAPAAWWSALVSREDPEIPELPVTPMVPMPPPEPAAEPAARDQEGPAAREPEEPAERPAPGAHDTTVMNVPELAAVLADAEAESEARRRGGNGAADRRDAQAAGRTMVMSAAEIKEITGQVSTDDPSDDGRDGDDEEGGEAAADSSPAADAGSNGAPGSNGDELRGKVRKTRRRRRR